MNRFVLCGGGNKLLKKNLSRHSKTCVQSGVATYLAAEDGPAQSISSTPQGVVYGTRWQVSIGCDGQYSQTAEPRRLESRGSVANIRRREAESAVDLRRPEIVSGSVANCHRHWQTGSVEERRRLESTGSVVDQRRLEAESAANHLRRSELSETTDPCRPEAAIIMADPRRSEMGGRAHQLRSEASIGAAGCPLPSGIVSSRAVRPTAEAAMNVATRLVAAAGLFRADVHRADRPMAVSINRALGVVAVTLDAATRTGERHRVRGRVAGLLEAIVHLATAGEISGSQFRCPRKTMIPFQQFMQLRRA